MALKVSGSTAASAPAQFLTATIEQRGNLFGDATSGSCLGQPIIFREQRVTDAPGTDRIYAANLNGFTSYPDGFWNGFTANVYTVTNGVRSRIASATVTASKVNLSGNVVPNSSGSTPGKVNALQFEYKLESYYRPSVDYWFRVAAVDGSGNVGAYSGWVAYTAPASLGSGTVSNTIIARGGTGTSGLAAPTSVAVVGKSGSPSIAQITWDAVGSATGYLVDISFQDPALNVSDEYLDINTSGLSIPAGAVVILEKAMLEPPIVASRVWTDSATVRAYTPPSIVKFRSSDKAAGSYSEWIAYTGGDPAPSGIDGTHFIRIPMTSSGTVAELFFHSGTNQEFYEVLEPGRTYKARFIMRASSSINATLNVQQVTTGGSATFGLTTSWQTFEHTFSRSTRQSGSTPYSWTLTVPSTVTVEIAAWWAPFDDAFDVGDFARIDKDRVTPGMFIRDHTQIKPGLRTSSMRQLFNRAGQAARGITLHSLLWRCKETDTLPWMQIEWHMSPGDWADLVAYLSAPVASGHPMAVLRAAQGQTAPWTDEFSKILLEFGNEAWNLLTGFWNTANTRFVDQGTLLTVGEGQTYGAHAQAAITEMEASPYYSAFAAKAQYLVGGRTGSNTDGSGANNFGLAALQTCPGAHGCGPAGYNGGWETTAELAGETGASFEKVLGFAPTIAYWKVYADPLTALGKYTMIYEAGPGYSLNGLNGAVINAVEEIAQECGSKSRAMGTGTLATFAIRAAAGVQLDNFFRVGSGSVWNSHAAEHEGGGTFPSYGLLKMVWDAVGPCRVDKLIIPGAPVRSGSAEGVLTPWPEIVELVQAFRFKSIATPSTQVIAVVNRDIDVSLLETDDPLYNATASGKHLVTVRTGIESCTGLQYYANAGNFREHNRYPVGFRRNVSINFDAGTLEFLVGETLTGATSGATARVEAVTVTSGSWAADNAAGVLRISKVTKGTTYFQDNEIITSSSGSATANGTLFSSGAYDQSDPLCVAITHTWTNGSALTNALAITINNTYGAQSDGLRAGNCVLIKMTGCAP
jgi:hypothetical protein